jgi:hypothetical protein
MGTARVVIGGVRTASVQAEAAQPGRICDALSFSNQGAGLGAFR